MFAQTRESRGALLSSFEWSRHEACIKGKLNAADQALEQYPIQQGLTTNSIWKLHALVMDSFEDVLRDHQCPGEDLRHSHPQAQVEDLGHFCFSDEDPRRQWSAEELNTTGVLALCGA